MAAHSSNPILITRKVPRSVSHRDWLVGDSRTAAAADRIYAAAADLIGRRGYDAFTIDALAARVHCSPATIYRHAGGKTAIREAVTLRASARVVDATRAAIDGRTGEDRIVTAVEVALRGVRSEKLAQLMGSGFTLRDDRWVTDSPVVTTLAREMLGEQLSDPAAVQWLIRTFLALWHWPADDSTERELVQRFLAPALAEIRRPASG
jgi:AcrR family transcriptional regulator